MLSESERQRSHLLPWLLSLLLALTALTLSLAFAAGAALGPRQNADIFTVACVMLTLVAALGLNRAGRYRAAAGLSVAVAAGGPWLSILLDPPNMRGYPEPMTFAGLSFLRCSLLFSTRITAALAIVQGAGLLLFPFIGGASQGIDWPSLWAFFWLTAIAGIVSARVRQV